MDLVDELFEDDEKDTKEMDKEIKLVNSEGMKDDIVEDMNNEGIKVWLLSSYRADQTLQKSAILTYNN